MSGYDQNTLDLWNSQRINKHFLMPVIKLVTLYD